ncbi:MAG: tyrosine-type recombinase/integrase [bacterium]
MIMQNYISQFINYLHSDKNASVRTMAAYRLDLEKFTEFLESRGKSNIKKVSRDDVRAFLSELTHNGIKKPNSAVTRARKLSSIKSFFKYLVQFDALTINPAAEVETPKLPHKEPSYLTKEEYEALIAAVKRTATPFYLARDLAIVITFLNTGVRLSELVGLKLTSVSLDSAQPTIKVRGKGDKERTIPLNCVVVEVLRKHLEKRPETDVPYLFISRLGNGLSTGSVYHLIKHYIKKAGIKKEHVGVHSLRHTFSVSLLTNGVDLFAIKNLLGHSKLETTSRYLHVSDAGLRDAVNRLT